ncbi:MAG: hypothetical protein AABZ27_06495 [Candidatus Omnitrophota bacterium]
MRTQHRNLLLFTLLFLIVIVVFFQKIPHSLAVQEDMRYLYQTWFHSYEEQDNREGPFEIYRHEGFKKFPASRFRGEYRFKEDGSCQWLALHPTDAHYLKSGTWEVSRDETQVILIYDQQQNLQESFRIIEIQKDLLRIEPIVFLPEENPENK